MNKDLDIALKRIESNLSACTFFICAVICFVNLHYIWGGILFFMFLASAGDIPSR